jgi:hypothetical protein
MLTYSYISDAFVQEKKKKKKNSTLSPQNNIESPKLNENIMNHVDNLNLNPYTNQYPSFVNFNQGVQNKIMQNDSMQNNQTENEENKLFKMFKEDYKDFQEWKKSKHATQPGKITGIIETFSNETPNVDEDFNQLLLYIFTGIFILFIYDNIYKIGKMAI